MFLASTVAEGERGVVQSFTSLLDATKSDMKVVRFPKYQTFSARTYFPVAAIVSTADPVENPSLQTRTDTKTVR